jgi:hypothetical protein
VEIQARGDGPFLADLSGFQLPDLRHHRRGAVANSGPLNASVRGVDAGATFAEGHELGAELIAVVPSSQTGRLLSGGEATTLLKRLEGRKPSRVASKPH